MKTLRSKWHIDLENLLAKISFGPEYYSINYVLINLLYCSLFTIYTQYTVYDRKYTLKYVQSK